MSDSSAHPTNIEPTTTTNATNIAQEAAAALEALHMQEVALASPDDYLSQRSDSAIVSTRIDGTASAAEAQQETTFTSGGASALEVAAAVGTGRPKVFLNVYDLVPPSRESAKGFSAEVLSIVGMGFHHSGVEILGQEYSFGSDESGRNDPSSEGVYSVYPRTACGHFKTQIELGEVPDQFNEVAFENILAGLRPKWRSHSYHILSHNCNHFTASLVTAIDGLRDEGVSLPENQKLISKYPRWVNRAAVSAGAVVPTTLVRSITDAINPPTACAPDLVNFIDIPAYEGDYPPPLGPQTLPPSNRWVPPPAEQVPVTAETVAAAAASAPPLDPSAATVNLAEGTQPQWGTAAPTACTAAETVPPPPPPTATSSSVDGHQDHTQHEQQRAGLGTRALGGLSLVGGFAKKMYKNVASTVRSSVVARVDAKDRQDYISSFEHVDADDLLSSYLCTVIHVNRPQKAKVFIAIDGIRIKGAHKLHLFIPYSEIHRYYYGAVIRPDERTDGNALPYFVPIDDPSKADCLLLILQIEDRGPGLRMIPLIDFSFLGGNFGAANLVAKSRDVLRNAMAYVDFGYRAAGVE